MSLRFQLLPQAGGYLVHVFLSSTSQVMFSIDFAHRIQSGPRPRLRGNRIRLRFPSEVFTKDSIQRLMDELQRLADDINVGRQRRRARVRRTGVEDDAGAIPVLKPGDPTRTDDEIATANRSRKPATAGVRGPEELPLPVGSMFPEWAVLLEDFGRSLGPSWPETAEYLARRLAGPITEFLALKVPEKRTAAREDANETRVLAQAALF